jgi:hypothetical protein
MACESPRRATSRRQRGGASPARCVCSVRDVVESTTGEIAHRLGRKRVVARRLPAAESAPYEPYARHHVTLLSVTAAHPCVPRDAYLPCARGRAPSLMARVELATVTNRPSMAQSVGAPLSHGVCASHRWCSPKVESTTPEFLPRRTLSPARSIPRPRTPRTSGHSPPAGVRAVARLCSTRRETVPSSSRATAREQTRRPLMRSSIRAIEEKARLHRRAGPQASPAIDEQGKSPLSRPAVPSRRRAKSELEDSYLPYKTKATHTRAMMVVRANEGSSRSRGSEDPGAAGQR